MFSLISVRRAAIDKRQLLDGVDSKRSTYIVDSANRVDLICKMLDLAKFTRRSIKTAEGLSPRIYPKTDGTQPSDL